MLALVQVISALEKWTGEASDVGCGSHGVKVGKSKCEGGKQEDNSAVSGTSKSFSGKAAQTCHDSGTAAASGGVGMESETMGGLGKRLRE